MKKCLHCNIECEDDVHICPKCGALVDAYIDHKKYMDVYHINHGKKIRNYRLILWFLIGLILPYIGFIVSWIMYDGDREKAKSILCGAIVSTLISTVLPYVLVYFFKDDNHNNSQNVGEQIKFLLDVYSNF